MEDEQVIQQLFRREEAGLSAIDSSYGNHLRRIALQICGNRQDAEEVVNDTLNAVWNTIPPEHPQVLFGFIARITRNLACKALRYRQAEKRAGTLSLDEMLEELLPAFEEEEGLAVSDTSEITDAINAFLDRCSELDRTIFVKRYFSAEQVQEIAKTVNLTPGTTAQRLLRMRQSLAAVLQERGIRL